MSKLKHKKKETKIPLRIYSKAEIEFEIAEQNKFKEKGKWTVMSWMRWYQNKGAIKIYDITQHQFGVILPIFDEIQELEWQINNHIYKEQKIEELKVEGLEKLAEGMQI